MHVVLHDAVVAHGHRTPQREREPCQQRRERGLRRRLVRMRELAVQRRERRHARMLGQRPRDTLALPAGEMQPRQVRGDIAVSRLVAHHSPGRT